MGGIKDAISRFRSDERALIYVPITIISFIISLVPFIIFGYYFLVLKPQGHPISYYPLLLVLGFLCSILAIVIAFAFFPFHENWIAGKDCTTKDKILSLVEWLCGYLSFFWVVIFATILIFPLFDKVKPLWMILGGLLVLLFVGGLVLNIVDDIKYRNRRKKGKW